MRALAFGLYPSLATASSILLRVAGDTGRFPLSAYETVLIDTPAASATSLIFAMTTPLLSYRVLEALR
jgi:hypothetical protein